MSEKKEAEFMSVNIWVCNDCGTAWRRTSDTPEACPLCGATDVEAKTEEGIDELMEIREFDEARFNRKWPEKWIHD